MNRYIEVGIRLVIVLLVAWAVFIIYDARQQCHEYSNETGLKTWLLPTGTCYVKIDQAWYPIEEVTVTITEESK